MINDLSIRLVNCSAENNKFSIDFVAGSLADSQVMCYLLGLILTGKNTQFGPLDAKTIQEEFQEDYYKTKNLFPSINQFDMVFSIEVDYTLKKQLHTCKFRDKESENMNIEILCVQSDHGGMRIDFHAADDEQLKNACYFIYIILRGKGAKDGEAYVETIYQQFSQALMTQKMQNVLTSVKDVCFMYAVLYESGDQKFVCYT